MQFRLAIGSVGHSRRTRKHPPLDDGDTAKNLKNLGG
jgi:hypothetical protein